MSKPFTVNTHRFDPYKNFRFKVRFLDGAGSASTPIAGVSKVSGLKRTTEVVKHRDGGDPLSSRKSPGRTEFEPVTLERGVTHDDAFEQWANMVFNYPATGEKDSISLPDFRRTIAIDLCNEAGVVVQTYHVFRCWVSEYQPLPDLDANGNAVAIQLIKLENEGWERDVTVVELPEEPFPTAAGA